MTSASLRLIACLMAVAATAAVPSANTSAEAPAIEFDMAPLAVAHPVSPSNESSFAVDVMQDETLVVCELNLSSMIAAPKNPPIDQWLVRCRPRDEFVMIADYHPRTEVASDLEGPIQVKKLDEKSRSLGIAVDGNYGHLATANLGADRGQKNIDSYQYNQIAPVQVVAASGTIDRGRGVYFKLRWTATQVLEGEKRFTLTFRVPQHWRSGLMDVSVIAQSFRPSFAKWDDDVKTIGEANFVVAVYREGDQEAARAAQTLADAEQKLREIAANIKRRSAVDSVPSMLRYVVKKFDLERDVQVSPWVDRLIAGQADPYLDKQIIRLPVDVRVAALDYCDARDHFAELQ